MSAHRAGKERGTQQDARTLRRRHRADLDEGKKAGTQRHRGMPVIVLLAWDAWDVPKRPNVWVWGTMSCRTRVTLQDHCPLLFNTGLPEREPARARERRLGMHSASMREHLA